MSLWWMEPQRNGRLSPRLCLREVESLRWGEAGEGLGGTSLPVWCPLGWLELLLREQAGRSPKPPVLAECPPGASPPGAWPGGEQPWASGQGSP